MPSRASKIGVVVIVLVLLGASGAYGYERMSTAHFYPDTRIGGVLVGSRSAAEATSILHDKFVLPLHEPISITAPDFKKKTSPWKMGMRLDVSDTVRDALVAQQVEPLPARIWHRAFGDGKDFDVRPAVDDSVFDAFLKTTIKKVEQDPQDARLEVVEGQVKLRVVPHKVGRKVDPDKAKERILDGLVAGASSVKVPVKVTQPALTTESFKRVILISTSANTLKLYKDGDLVKKYAVATGTGGYPTPHGQFRITVKRMNPTWYNPNSDWSRGMPAFIPPGRNNPLGTRALNLNASGIRIHGSPDAASIGTNASHGCIRMHIADSEDLFDRVEVGTPVLIVY
jgi:lipoprotein-anchoring transpeptidase ErfK/SrfK